MSSTLTEEEADGVTSFLDSPSSFRTASSNITTADDDSSFFDGESSFPDSPSSFRSANDNNSSCFDDLVTSSSYLDTVCPNLTIYDGGGASPSTHSSSLAPVAASSSSRPPRRLKYDVFLSFRGNDTRHSFVSHLYHALNEKGIATFKDDRDLERGKPIEEILLAIQQSRFSIVVFSRNYASSSFCLDELQTIVEEETPHALLPIFYGVEPDDVSNVDNSSCYAESFAKHKKDFPDHKLEIWKASLRKAANQSGWCSYNKDEHVLIEEIVADMLKKLSRPQVLNKSLSGLVGMELRIKEVESELHIGLDDVRMVGIWGMPGIGKKTIAKAVYDHISHEFEACCFLESVREEVEKAAGLNHLRNILVSSLMGLRILDVKNWDALREGRFRQRRVLVVLDDVSDIGQLQTLAMDRKLFGPGSRIIITTRDKQVLEQHEVDSIYEPKPLSDVESLRLFRQHAFSKNKKEGAVESSQRFVDYCKGIPLVLKLVGRSLFNKDNSIWESRLNALEEDPPEDIINFLTRASFDVLETTVKSIFLDIACFCKGEDEDYVVSILEGRGCPTRHGLEVLRQKCLISRQEGNTNKVWMHDLMQQMGRKVVRQESWTDVGMRSRLWSAQEICPLLAKNMGTNKVEGIILDISEAKTASPLGVEAFQSMSRLRFLKESKLHFSGKLNTLSKELRVLHWYECPLKSLPADLYSCNLVELNLSYNRLKNLWTGKQVLDNLKFMKLSYSRKLTQTPDFQGTKNLKILILEGCAKLIQVHPSVGSLEKLTYLNLKDCKRLQNLPKSMGTRSLEILILSGCSKLKRLPEMKPNMGSLKELLLNGTGISRLPASIAHLTGLVELSVTSCKRLQFIPEAVGKCRSLKILRLTGCSELRLLNFDLDMLENLEELRADGTRLWLRFMMVRSNSTPLKLKVLTFRGCHRSPLSLPDFFRDHMIQSEPARESLKKMFWFGNPDWHLCGTAKLAGVTSLDLSNSNLKELPFQIKALSCLITLELSGNPIVSLGKELPSNLKILILANCCDLLSLPSLPSTTHRVEAPNCKSLSKVDPPQGIESGRERGLNFMNCNRLGDDEVPRLLQIHVVEALPHSIDRMSIIAPLCRMPSRWLHNGHLPSLDTDSPKRASLTLLPSEPSYTTVRGFCVWVIFEVLDFRCRAKASLKFDMSCDGTEVVCDEIELNEGTECDSDQLWLAYIPITLFNKLVRGKQECLIEATFETNIGVLLVKSYGLFLARRHKDGHFLEPWIPDTVAEYD
ncbi:Disease resistance protein RUN1 [Linum perenne]